MFSNKFDIKKDKNNIIFIINSATLDDKIFVSISKHFKTVKSIGFDMKNVSFIKSKKFLNALINKKIKLFNLQNEILVYLSIILKDSLLNSFICENDFKLNKYELIKRCFLVV